MMSRSNRPRAGYESQTTGESVMRAPRIDDERGIRAARVRSLLPAFPVLPGMAGHDRLAFEAVR